MKPPAKTSFTRMLRTAMLEAERIEIGQDYWIGEGRISAPHPDIVRRRDDFAGIVRMIDAIENDPDLLDRVKRAMAAQAAAAEPPAAPAPAEDDLVYDVEVAD
jgi:hypothetical protein